MRKGGNSSARSDSGVEGVEVSQGLDHSESQPPLTPHPPSKPGTITSSHQQPQVTREERLKYCMKSCKSPDGVFSSPFVVSSSHTFCSHSPLDGGRKPKAMITNPFEDESQIHLESMKGMGGGALSSKWHRSQIVINCKGGHRTQRWQSILLLLKWLCT